MAQDVVGRRDMKEELWTAERQQQRVSCEVSLSAVLESEGDFLVGCRFDLGARQALHEIDRRGYPRLEFGDVRLGVRKCVWGMAGQQRAGNGRMPIGFAHLLL